MAKTATLGRDVYVPNDSFTVNLDGVDVVFVRDVTRIREGHPILDKYPGKFERIRVHYDLESADVEELRA